MKRILALLFAATLVIGGISASSAGSEDFWSRDEGDYECWDSLSIQVNTANGIRVIEALGYPEYGLEAIEIINRYRTGAGLRELVYDQTLYDASVQRAVETTVSWSHTRPDGSAWSTVCSSVNGENIAMGYYSCDMVVRGWMNSRGHRENIMRPQFTRTAVACIEAEDGEMYWVQLFGC